MERLAALLVTLASVLSPAPANAKLGRGTSDRFGRQQHRTQWTVYTSAIPASSTQPAAARAFVKALTSPAMAARWTAGGFEPPK